MYFYQYLELHHAAQTQFGASGPVVDEIRIDTVMNSNSTKGLISSLQAYKLNIFWGNAPFGSKVKWEEDLGESAS